MINVAYVDLSDDEHLREYARQLERCRCEAQAFTSFSIPPENEESEKLSGMIYEMVKG